MTIELLPGTTNVVRFPIEERARPTLDLLREIAREVGLVADFHGLDLPSPDFRHRVDAGPDAIKKRDHAHEIP